MHTAIPRLALPVGFLTLLAAASTSPFERQDEVTLATRNVRGNVWMIEGAGGFAGGNVAVLAEKDGALVVDDFVAPLAKRLDEQLATVLEKGGGRVRYLVNTHWHADHTGNNALLVAKGAEVLAHENARRRLAGDSGIGGRTAKDTPSSALPSLTYDEGIAVHVAGETVRIRHVGPAHTDGDSIVWFPRAKVVHLGDCMFNGRFPFVDLMSGGSHVGMLGVIDAVLAEVDDTWQIIPGHGPLATRDDLVTYREMLDTCIERVRTKLAAGEDFKAMMEAGLIDDYAATWRWDFIDEKKFLNGLVEELSR